MSEINDKQWAMLCHISSLAGYIIPLGNVIAPYIIWHLKKDQSPTINEHGKESVNFQISITIYVLVSLVLIVLLIGIPLLVAIGIFQVIMIIIATIKADNGELYHYPLTIRFIK